MYITVLKILLITACGFCCHRGSARAILHSFWKSSADANSCFHFVIDVNMELNRPVRLHPQSHKASIKHTLRYHPDSKYNMQKKIIDTLKGKVFNFCT